MEFRNIISVSLVWLKPNLHKTTNQITSYITGLIVKH